MARPILSDYGPERSVGGKRAECGGVTMKDKVDVRNYSPPVGPNHIMKTGVGLRGGTNVGYCGSQGRYGDNSGGYGDGAGGAPGVVRKGGENIGRGGTQGRR